LWSFSIARTEGTKKKEKSPDFQFFIFNVLAKNVEA
jgi:hypothetical protein